MDREQFIERVMQRGGFARADEAERAIDATLATLGERLSDEDARAIAAELPAPLGKPVERAMHGALFGAVGLYDRVAAREPVRLGFAVEHTQVVCETIADAISDETLAALQKHLPAQLGGLFERRIPPPPPERLQVHPHGSARGFERTLAVGRPGSVNPISEANPAHTQSVARSDDPHGDTKLSSSTGLTQERLGETLATGRPGSGWPMSGR